MPDRLLHLSALASRGNDGELLPPQAQLADPRFGVKLVSKTADWAGLTGFAVSLLFIRQ